MTQRQGKLPRKRKMNISSTFILQYGFEPTPPPTPEEEESEEEQDEDEDGFAGGGSMID